MNNKDTKKRKVKYKGELDLAGFKLPCYVLEDGTRVLSGRGMANALRMAGEVEKGKEKPGNILRKYLSQKSLKPFIYKEKNPEHFDPVVCYIGGTKTHGYEATILVDICDAFLEARKSTHLSPRQKIIADQCEILVRSFAKVGIIALIDEATGYQKEREETLQAILKLYISEEILKWQKTFHNEFYEQIFRLWNLPFTPENMNKRPSFIGILTNKLIYENLPKGSFVLEKLKEKTPKTKGGHLRYRLHQSLTEMGREELKKAIYTLVAYARISKDKNKFLRLMEESRHLQKPLPYIDIDAMDDKDLVIVKESEFNKAVKVLLKTPPKKNNESKEKK
jgi:P63C domain